MISRFRAVAKLQLLENGRRINPQILGYFWLYLSGQWQIETEL